MAAPTFSLIVATMGDADGLDRLMRSVAAQAATVEVIVVDQNGDDRVREITTPWRAHLEVRVLNAPRGLSRARNVGLPHARGQIIAFPDDDAWYPDGLLLSIARRLDQDPHLHGLTGRTVDQEGRSPARWNRSEGQVTLATAWTRMASSSIFLRRTAVEIIGPFDEELGLGAGTPYEGAEDLDYVLRAVRSGLRVRYDPALVVHHPYSHEPVGPRARSRALSYGAGAGRAWRKNRLPLWLVARQLARPLLGVAVAAARGDLAVAITRTYSVRGRVRGWASRAR
jgi:glycosyltransferase involved in cell wall biosynthesis